MLAQGSKLVTSIQWWIQGGGPVAPPPPPFLEFFFYKSEVEKQKTSIKWVRNLSQNAGNGHFRDSNVQKFLGVHAQNPPRKLAPSVLIGAPLPFLKHLDLPLQFTYMYKYVIGLFKHA